MKHLKSSQPHMQALRDKALGKFYTPDFMGRLLAQELSSMLNWNMPLRVIDPFCGDGRLIKWLLESASNYPLKRSRIDIHLWDIDEQAIKQAQSSIKSSIEKHNINARVKTAHGDTFERAQENEGIFDLVITNPPWELLKPDRRELAGTSDSTAALHREWVRDRAEYLRETYKESLPSRSFAGWGVNLARTGVEASIRLAKSGGVVGIISPASLFADQVSANLRQWIFDECEINSATYYPAESKAFAGVDQQCTVFVATRSNKNTNSCELRQYTGKGTQKSLKVSVNKKTLQRLDFRLPLHFSPYFLEVHPQLNDFPTFHDFESKESQKFWAGRELDETKAKPHICSKGIVKFLKGRHIKRYSTDDLETDYISADSNLSIPESTKYNRLVWRDVSRPTQDRRMKATIIPPGPVTGNSLNLCHTYDNNLVQLQRLLGLFNSYSFEFMARSFSATSHLSLGTIRLCPVPDLGQNAIRRRLDPLVKKALSGNIDAEFRIDALIARAYEFSRDQYIELIESFPKIMQADVERLVNAYDQI